MFVLEAWITAIMKEFVFRTFLLLLKQSVKLKGEGVASALFF